MELKNRIKRMSLILILITIMVIGLVEGCSRESKVSQDAGTEESIVLTMWSIATESDAFHPAYLRAVQEFEKNHPGVKIKLETFENESYKTKIKSAVAANELPDIFFTWGGGFSKPFVESGKIMDLTVCYEAYKTELPEHMLENVTYNGRIYGSATSAPVSVMFYNNKIFTGQNLSVPATWEEWLEVCQALRAEGITPIGTSVKDTWVLAMLHDGITLKSAGPKKIKQALLTDKLSYDSPEFLAPARMLRELIGLGAFNENAMLMSNDEVAREFYSAQTAMYITGSWAARAIWMNAENPEDFGVAPIPLKPSDNAAATDFMGGPSDMLMAASETEFPELAARAVFELARDISRYAYLDGAGIPAWKINYDDSQVNPLAKAAAEYAADATSFTLWFDMLLASEEAKGYQTLLQDLFVGKITPEEFTMAMELQLQK